MEIKICQVSDSQILNMEKKKKKKKKKKKSVGFQEYPFFIQTKSWRGFRKHLIKNDKHIYQCLQLLVFQKKYFPIENLGQRKQVIGDFARLRKKKDKDIKLLKTSRPLRKQ